MPDKRSYRVNFDKFLGLANKEFIPKISLKKTVEKLKKELLPFKDRITKENRSYLIRLDILRYLKNNNILNDKLNWNCKI